jgi:transcriptional regulator with XRE-family HTH domain
MDDLHRRLVRQIKAQAKKRKIALTHIPDRAGVSRSQFWDVLAGNKSPTLRWLGKVADALGVDAALLLGSKR